ncbi:hypothetical protein KAJ27_15350 [bacterium]|nr:hypothetical protein [bacterium]
MIIAVYPLRGLDIASCEFVRSRLLAMKEKGAAILLISEEIDEILEISDRVGVMLEGEMNGIIETASATPEWIGKRMAEKL